MKILGLSTSSDFLSIAVCENNISLSAFHEKVGKRHSNYLIKYIKEILASAKINISDINLISVDIGPGSFTGLRIGVTAMKTIAKIEKIPIVGISSLDTIAYGIDHKGNKINCVILDAKRDKIYSSIYKKNKRVSKYFLTNIKDLLSYINKEEEIIFLGDGIKLYEAKIKEILFKSFSSINIRFAPESKWYPKANNIVKLGLLKFKSMGPDNVDGLVPMYLYSRECSIRGV